MKLKTLGVVLVSSDGYYLSENGKLPARPSWDKPFLMSLIADKIVLCSPNTEKDMPPSFRKAVIKIVTDPTEFHHVNFGISTFKSCPPTLLLLMRSKEPLGGGKYLRLDWLKDYESLFTSSELEIWKRNDD